MELDLIKLIKTAFKLIKGTGSYIYLSLTNQKKLI